MKKEEKEEKIPSTEQDKKQTPPTTALNSTTTTVTSTRDENTTSVLSKVPQQNDSGDATTPKLGIRQRDSNLATLWKSFLNEKSTATPEELNEFISDITKETFVSAYPVAVVPTVEKSPVPMISFKTAKTQKEIEIGLTQLMEKYPDSHKRKLSKGRQTRLEKISMGAFKLRTEMTGPKKFSDIKLTKTDAERSKHIFATVMRRARKGEIEWNTPDGLPEKLEWQEYGDWEKDYPEYQERRTHVWNSIVDLCEEMGIKKLASLQPPSSDDLPIYSRASKGHWKCETYTDGRFKREEIKRTSSSSSSSSNIQHDKMFDTTTTTQSSIIKKEEKIKEEPQFPTDQIIVSDADIPKWVRIDNTSLWMVLTGEASETATPKSPKSVYILAARDDFAPKQYESQIYVGSADGSICSRWFAHSPTQHLSVICRLIDTAIETISNEDAKTLKEPSALLVEMILAYDWIKYSTWKERAMLFALKSNLPEHSIVEEKRLIQALKTKESRYGLNGKD
jgi:hypothetical protein